MCSKYGSKQSNLARVKYLVITDVNMFLRSVFPEILCPAKWKDLVTLSEKCIHDIKNFHVQRCKPPRKWVKVNSDWSSLNNLGSTGGSGIIRNERGEFIFA